MDGTEIAVGMKVRYPSTGTEGQVAQLKEIDGEIFAEIDSTGLFYRVDRIIPVEKFKEKAKGRELSVEEALEKDKTSTENLWEGVDRVDGECGG